MPKHDEAVAEVLAEMRARSFKVHQTLLDDLARIEAAIERDRTSRRSIKIPIEIKPTSESHRALATWILLAEWLIKNAGKDALGQGIAEIVPQLRARIDESRAVLAKPLRNGNRFHDWDSAEAEYQKLVEEGKVEDGTWCEWLFASAAEGGGDGN